MESEPTPPAPISVTQALTELAEGGIIIDVRTPTEYERGHIPGARLVKITDLQSDPMTAIWGDDPLAMLDPDTKNKLVVVISTTSAHANAISHLLVDLGLNAKALKGGLIGWVRDGQILIPGTGH